MSHLGDPLFSAVRKPRVFFVLSLFYMFAFNGVPVPHLFFFLFSGKGTFNFLIFPFPDLCSKLFDPPQPFHDEANSSKVPWLKPSLCGPVVVHLFYTGELKFFPQKVLKLCYRGLAPLPPFLFPRIPQWLRGGFHSLFFLGLPPLS